MLQNLLSIKGDGVGPEAKAKPSRVARDITIRGVGFRDAGYTYMNPHGMPGGGDWAHAISSDLVRWYHTKQALGIGPPRSSWDAGGPCDG